MEPTLVDGAWLGVTLPEGFVRVAHAELESLMGAEHACMWGVRDTQRKALICVTWKDSNKLLTKLVSEKSFAKQVDESFAKRYRRQGYRCEGYFVREVAGADNPAQGFSFAYVAEGVAHCGEVLVFKRGIRCYTLRYLANAAAAEANQPIIRCIVDSLNVK